MALNQGTLFNFLPFTNLEDVNNLQQLNEYFRQIDDSLISVNNQICALGLGEESPSDNDRVELALPSGQAGLSALRVVAVDPETGQVRDADSGFLEDQCQVVGITLNAGPTIGSVVNIVNQGVIQDDSFAFDLSADPALFLNGVGVISQTPPTTPTSAFNLQIGQVIASDTILIDLSQAIRLA